MEVTDPRDRIYGVIGMINNICENQFSDFKIDYSRSVAEVSLYLSQNIIEKTGHLAWLPRPSIPHQRLPSWSLGLREAPEVCVAPTALAARGLRVMNRLGLDDTLQRLVASKPHMIQIEEFHCGYLASTNSTGTELWEEGSLVGDLPSALRSKPRMQYLKFFAESWSNCHAHQLGDLLVLMNHDDFVLLRLVSSKPSSENEDQEFIVIDMSHASREARYLVPTRAPWAYVSGPSLRSVRPDRVRTFNLV